MYIPKEAHTKIEKRYSTQCDKLRIELGQMLNIFNLIESNDVTQI